LRRDATRAEWTIWRRIRNRQLGGCKFVRQVPLGPYYVDFLCRERLLVVEVDGGQHADNPLDHRRDGYLTSLGYRVIRFWNNDVLQNTEGVLRSLLQALEDAPHPNPLPASVEREVHPAD
jgi:very-short-patch-repair endonuclease